VKEHHCCSVYVINFFQLRPEDTNSMKETYRIGKPRYVAIQEDRWNDEKARNMMNVE
jgi:hypothetical protein